jgi:hypothetical protein
MLLYLPDSPLYPTLSTLPTPDFTNPTSTTTFHSQAAIHDSLPILEEVVSLIETDEHKTLEGEIARRRTRLTAEPRSPQEVKNEVVREVYSDSKVIDSGLSTQISLIAASCLYCMMKSSITLIPRTNFVVGRSRSYFVTSETIFFLYHLTIPRNDNLL